MICCVGRRGYHKHPNLWPRGTNSWEFVIVLKECDYKLGSTELASIAIAERPLRPRREL